MQQQHYRLVVCSGPSGSGKSTLLQRLMADYPHCFKFSVSHTTRQPRPGEVDGREYYFVTRDAMNELIAQGQFIEHAEFSGNMYGTSQAAIRSVLSEGRICLLDIDMNGVKSLKKVREFEGDVLYISVQPPSMEALEDRLRGRKTESEQALRLRLDTAAMEMRYAVEPGNFDCAIVNDDVERAYGQLVAILQPSIEHVRSHAS